MLLVFQNFCWVTAINHTFNVDIIVMIQNIHEKEIKSVNHSIIIERIA